MMSIPTRPCVVAGFVLPLLLAISAPLAAQPVASPVRPVEVVNTDTNPVPVVVKGGPAEELIFFRGGYQVPAGKRLLVDDVSVECIAQSPLPFSPGFSGAADYERFGTSATTVLSIFYESADCPEPLGVDGLCNPQRHVVGTAQRNGLNETFQTLDGRPGGEMGAGRRMAVFVEQGGKLRGLCFGVSLDFPASGLTGVGRLVDRP